MVATGEVNVTNLKDRALKILKEPKTEWTVIDGEATDTAKLYSGYIAPLAAIPVIANFIGMSFVGLSLPFVGTFRVGIVRGLVNACVSYVLTLAGVYISALVIDKLAPTFESKPNPIQALKLVAYACTPVWIAGVAGIIPALAPLAAIVGGLYAIYLFYLGLPVLMKTPEAKVIPYMLVAALVIIVVTIVVGVVTGMLVGVGAPTTTF